jgi:methylmalonyl-CoA mutase C-terminal domain/subunit
VDDRPIRVLLAKVGLDGHDRGVKTVARGLRDAGMEVVFTGLRATPDEVAEAASQEDVDVVGLSFLAGDHLVLAPKVIDGLKKKGMGGVMVLAGGVILKRDIPALVEMGVTQVFLPGTPPGEIARFIESRIERTNSAEEQGK